MKKKLIALALCGMAAAASAEVSVSYVCFAPPALTQAQGLYDGAGPPAERPYAVITYRQTRDSGRPGAFFLAGVNPGAVKPIDDALAGVTKSISGAMITNGWAVFAREGSEERVYMRDPAPSATELVMSLYGYQPNYRYATLAIGGWEKFEGGLYPPLVVLDEITDEITYTIPLNDGTTETTEDTLGAGVYVGHGVLTDEAINAIEARQRLAGQLAAKVGGPVRGATQSTGNRFAGRSSAARDQAAAGLVAREGSMTAASSRQDVAKTGALSAIASSIQSGDEQVVLAYLNRDMTDNIKIEKVMVLPNVNCKPPENVGGYSSS